MEANMVKWKNRLIDVRKIGWRNACIYGLRNRWVNAWMDVGLNKQLCQRKEK